jgi:GTP cyclohydrolase FolE2
VGGVQIYHIVWVQCRVITLCGCSEELSHCVGAVQLSHCVGAVQSYHIVWVQCRVITLCGCSAELPHCVGAVQSYHIVWVQCRITTLCGCSAELSHCFLELRGAVHYFTTLCKGSISYFENDPCQHSGRHTQIGKRKDGLRGLYHQFHLADSKSFVSQTPKISSHRPQHFHLRDPKISSYKSQKFPTAYGRFTKKLT